MFIRIYIVAVITMLIVSCGGGYSSGQDNQNTTVTPDTPTVTPETPTVTPETPTVTPDTPTVTPETPTVTPETPTVTPETPTVTPETPTVTPETPTVTPETPAVTIVTTVLNTATKIVTVAEDTVVHFRLDKGAILQNVSRDEDTSADLYSLTVFDESSLNGSVKEIDTSAFEYMPDANYNGSDVIEYVLCLRQCFNGYVYISITAVYDAPVTKDDIMMVLTQSVTANITGNDLVETDIDSLTILEPAKYGTAVLTLENIEYQPENIDDGFTDYVVYQLCDSLANCATATLTLQRFEAITSRYNVRVATSHNSVTTTALFEEKTDDLNINHTYANDISEIGGVAVVDINNDDYLDIFFTGGRSSTASLLINKSGSSFDDESIPYSLGLQGRHTQPLFIDIDNDDDLDLIMGVADDNTLVLQNNGSKNFSRIENALTLNTARVYGINVADLDKNEDLDFVFTNWLSGGQRTLWFSDDDDFVLMDDTLLANSKGKFAKKRHNHDCESQITAPGNFWGLTPNIVDINNDFVPDILVASDFASSYLLINDYKTFELSDQVQFSDCNAMGSIVADYDNDGDMDWFVSSIYDTNGVEANWGANGNRFYQNNGSGAFEDVSEAAGIVDGSWGWGSCFTDFNNDGFVDIFHVNGMNESTIDSPEFDFDFSRLFISNKDGTYTERSQEWGLVDNAQGRGVVCFDYDRDGDIDIAVQNVNLTSASKGHAALWHNNYKELSSKTVSHFINVKLEGNEKNPLMIGAKVIVTSGDLKQTKEVRFENGYMSQSPLELHFGLGPHKTVDKIEVYWPAPYYKLSTLEAVPANQFISIAY